MEKNLRDYVIGDPPWGGPHKSYIFVWKTEANKSKMAVTSFLNPSSYNNSKMFSQLEW